jgi:hypothetical protein
MLFAIFSCLMMIALTTVVHYEVLRMLYALLPALHIPSRTKLLVVVFTAFAAHTVEIGLYGVVLFVLIKYVGVGGLTGADGATLLNCLYFSAETYSSLGFGDLIPMGPIRLLAGAEALNGLLLLGWSASYIYIAMERFWNLAAPDSQPRAVKSRSAKRRLASPPHGAVKLKPPLAAPENRPCGQTGGWRPPA